MITITETRDHELIAALNEEVQNLHHHMHPAIFKPFNKAATTDAIKDFFLDPHCRAFIAIKDTEVIGYAIFMIKETKENAFHHGFSTLYIDQICVLEHERQSGAGRLLMQQAEKLALEHTVTRIELDHWSANNVAAKFFRNNGYVSAKERLWKLIIN